LLCSKGELDLLRFCGERFGSYPTDLLQQLNSRDLALPDWGTKSYDCSKQLMTIAPDLLGMGAPLRLPCGTS
jgi:hypothetical protein